MKSTLKFILFCLALLALSYCGKPKESASGSDTTTLENPETAATESGTSALEGTGNTISLKGIYATSTQIPASEYGYASLFDGNKNTYWATMPGAGADEGIMLYFPTQQKISHLEIIQPQGKNFAAIELVTVYINGVSSVERSAVDKKIEINSSTVQSLFIRINNVSNTTNQDIEGITVYDFPSTSFVGISELVLYNGDKQLSLKLPSVVKATMKASSTLQPEISYGIRNLFDSRKEFVWVEGAKSSGQNEFLAFSFQDEQEITGLKIMNGFQRSEKHFTANGRVKSLTVSNEKKESGDVSVKDNQNEQTLQLATPVKGKEITLTIKDVYPGTTYKDLVISELEFINKNGDFIIEDNLTEPIKQDLLAKAKNTILGKVLDKRIANELEEAGDNFKRSLILRSDYTFVAYSESWTEVSSGSEAEEIIADGNWEIKELTPGFVKIRIFGKLIRQSESTDYYNGDTSESYLKIFQDNLILDAVSIRGEKIIEELKLPTNEN